MDAIKYLPVYFENKVRGVKACLVQAYAPGGA